MKYFEFKFIETKDGQIINQGDGLYYSSSEQDLNQMKEISRTILKNTSAVISITLITEIDRDSFIKKGGNPNVH